MKTSCSSQLVVNALKMLDMRLNAMHSVTLFGDGSFSFVYNFDGQRQTLEDFDGANLRDLEYYCRKFCSVLRESNYVNHFRLYKQFGNKMYFRRHCATLQDSMATLIALPNNHDALVRFLLDMAEEYDFEGIDYHIVCDPQEFNEFVGHTVHAVKHRTLGIIGYLDRMPGTDSDQSDAIPCDINLPKL